MMKALSSHSLHLVLSLFFLPMIVVYAVTGLLYMGGVDQHFTSHVEVHELNAAPTSRPMRIPAGNWNAAE